MLKTPQRALLTKMSDCAIDFSNYNSCSKESFHSNVDGALELIPEKLKEKSKKIKSRKQSPKN